MAKLYGVCGRQLSFDATAPRRARADRGTGSNRREKQRPGNAGRRIKRKRTQALSKPEEQGPKYCRVTTKSAIRRVLGVLGDWPSPLHARVAAVASASGKRSGSSCMVCLLVVTRASQKNKSAKSPRSRVYLSGRGTKPFTNG